MSRNIRISRLGQVPGLGESTLGRNRKIEIFAAKTTTTKALLALILICSGQAAWSYTVSGNTYTTNGSQADVQAACNAVPDNGTATVVIPSGTYSWTGTLTINKSLTLQGTNPGSWGNPTPESSYPTVIQNNTVGANMINATSSLNGHIIIAYICFRQLAQNSAGSAYCLSLDRSDWNGTSIVATPYTCMVHDCFLDAGTVGSYIAWIRANGIIVWNCTLIGNSGFELVCGKYGYTASWNTPDTYGIEDTTGLGNTYFENCYIGVGGTGASQYTINLDDNARCVFRNSTFQDSALGSHGQESSPIGGRSFELYNNTFRCTSGNPQNMQNYFSDRGGAGVMWGNTVDVIPFGKPFIGFFVFSTQSTQQIPQQTGYPAARQCGQGWSASSANTYGHPVVSADGTGQVTTGTYIWNNTGWSNTDPNFVSSPQGYMALGRDYFFSAKPGYTPYTYPHPLHSQFASVGGSSSTPTPNATPLAPLNLRVN